VLIKKSFYKKPEKEKKEKEVAKYCPQFSLFSLFLVSYEVKFLLLPDE
jgi:hypothetical protein